MRAYYNENDPYAAQWLRNLISENLIAPGDVDDRSILDVKPDDLAGYIQCHFFAGIGGWSRALRLAGWPDDRPVWTGSCPCQPFSVAGKRKGFDDSRHLFPVWFRLIAERRPAVVFGEQVAAASDWLRLVRSDLEALDYAVGAIPMEAASAGADHLRNRYWYIAESDLGLADGRGPQARQSAAAALGHRGATVSAGSDGVALGDADLPGSQGRQLHAECAGERAARSTGMADGQSKRRPDRDVGSLQGPAECKWSSEQSERCGGDAGIEWVIGADGKARRVKSGIRLLAHGVSGRVAVRRTREQGGAEIQDEHWFNRIGALRAFGNAIDPRPGAAFITAYMDFCLERELLQ